MEKRTPRPCAECLREGWTRSLLAGRIEEWFEFGPRPARSTAEWIEALKALRVPSLRGLPSNLDWDAWDEVETPSHEEMVAHLENKNAWAVCHHGNRRGKYPFGHNPRSAILFGRGRYTMLRDVGRTATVAISGAAEPSERALETAAEVAASVVANGGWVVGSLDHPIESAAISSALTTGGKAIAFTGKGLPAAEEIDARILERGLVLSYTTPGTEPYAWTTFASRVAGINTGEIRVILEHVEKRGEYTPVDQVLDEPGIVLVDPLLAGGQAIVESSRRRRGRRSAVEMLNLDSLAYAMESKSW